ncbi:hypothetical protein JavanS175_0015 [Streptococcus satellite phage Javan175]|uniref:hypothetical protein n=1 Tax=Streptococcus entericus TaxID=155680 RepID=UPI000374238C|nr:hypothetical protein [Streptococcus entericus]QBX07756.1 hypothetical protein JavanS175_0015 [Streptococcus satellite phage Javan175]
MTEPLDLERFLDHITEKYPDLALVIRDFVTGKIPIATITTLLTLPIAQRGAWIRDYYQKQQGETP